MGWLGDVVKLLLFCSLFIVPFVVFLVIPALGTEDIYVSTGSPTSVFSNITWSKNYGPYPDGKLNASIFGTEFTSEYYGDMDGDSSCTSWDDGTCYYMDTSDVSNDFSGVVRFNITIPSNATSNSIDGFGFNVHYGSNSGSAQNFHLLVWDFSSSDWVSLSNVSGGAQDFVWNNHTFGYNSNYVDGNSNMIFLSTGNCRNNIDCFWDFGEFNVSYSASNSAPTVDSIVEPTDPSTYSFGSDYVFKVNVTDTDGVSEFDVCNFTFDGTIYSVSNYVDIDSDTREYNYTLSDLGVQSSTSYSFCVNDTSDESACDSGSFTVSQAVPSLSLSNTGGNKTYGNAVNVEWSESNDGDGDVSYVLERNGTSLGGSSDTTVLGGGIYNYTYYTTGGTNYSSTSDGVWVEITKAPTSISVSSNVSTISNNTVVNITSVLNVSGNVNLSITADDISDVKIVNESSVRVFVGNSSTNPPGSLGVGTEETTFVNMVSDDDSTYYDSFGPVGNTTFQRFNVTVDGTDLSWLYFLWDGKHNKGSAQYINISVYDFNGGSWVVQNSTNLANSTEGELTYNITSGLSNYVGTDGTVECMVSLPDSGGIRLQTDYVEVDYGYSPSIPFFSTQLDKSSPYENVSTFYDSGNRNYLVNSTFLGNTNYTSSTSSMYIYLDFDAPSMSSVVYEDSVMYGGSTASYQYNVSVSDSDGVDVVLLEFNGVNYTMSNESSVYYRSLVGHEAGSYSFRFFANDTVGNSIYTGTYSQSIVSEGGGTSSGDDGGGGSTGSVSTTTTTTIVVNDTDDGGSIKDVPDLGIVAKGEFLFIGIVILGVVLIGLIKNKKSNYYEVKI